MHNTIRLLFALLCAFNFAHALYVLNFRSEYQRGFWSGFFLAFNLTTQIPAASYFLWLAITDHP